MSTQHDRLIQAGAPCLPDEFMYAVAITPHMGSYRVVVDVRHEGTGELHASVERRFTLPAVSDLVDMATMATKRAWPEHALSAPVRALVFGPH